MLFRISVLEVTEGVACSVGFPVMVGKALEIRGFTVVVATASVFVVIFICGVTSPRFIVGSIVFVDSVKVPGVVVRDGVMASPKVLVVAVVLENAETVNIPSLSSGMWFGIVVVLYSSKGALETARGRLEIRESLLSPARGAARDESVMHKNTSNQKPGDANIFN